MLTILTGLQSPGPIAKAMELSDDENVSVSENEQVQSLM
jgi:hypothetical protein